MKYKSGNVGITVILSYRKCCLLWHLIYIEKCPCLFSQVWPFPPIFNTDVNSRVHSEWVNSVSNQLKWVFQLFVDIKMLSLIAALLVTQSSIDEEMLCKLSVKCVLMPAVAVRDRL